ncbi:MAG TPA: hypothetical protein VGL81_34295 [Polyangiaceae bacterium]|jgi:hypothetical protein
MTRTHSISLSALVLAVAVPFAWLACGGGKPPETPADESSSNSDGGESTAASASSASPSSSSASAGDDSSTAAPAASATAAPPPAPPALSDTDCGKCIDKTCAKAETACGKATDCQSMLDGVHACTTAAGGCIANASMPSAGKPKKLAAGFATCAKKAVSGKACKAKCQ